MISIIIIIITIIMTIIIIIIFFSNFRIKYRQNSIFFVANTPLFFKKNFFYTRDAIAIAREDDISFSFFLYTKKIQRLFLFIRG